MDVAIKQVGQRDAEDRFVLVDVKTRKVVTQNDASAEAIERFFRKKGVPAATIQSCLKQRKRFRAQQHPPTAFRWTKPRKRSRTTASSLNSALRATTPLRADRSLPTEHDQRRRKSSIVPQLARMGVSVMLAGNMGGGAVNILASNGIKVIRGCSGNVHEVARAWLAGSVNDSGTSCQSHNSRGCPGHS